MKEEFHTTTVKNIVLNFNEQHIQILEEIHNLLLSSQRVSTQSIEFLANLKQIVTDTLLTTSPTPLYQLKNVAGSEALSFNQTFAQDPSQYPSNRKDYTNPLLGDTYGYWVKPTRKIEGHTIDPLPPCYIED